MAIDAYRWQAAMGAIAGAIAAEALAQGVQCWTPTGEAIVDQAENLLSGAPVPIDLVPAEAIAVAVALWSTGPPLLVDPQTVSLFDRVAEILAHPGANESRRGVPPTFAAVVEAAGVHDHSAVLAGADYGLVHGVGAVPARLVSTMRASDGRRGRRYLSRLTDRLLGVDRNDWYDPRGRRGPREVLPGLWLSNIHGLASFVRDHADGLVLSLCDVEGRLDGHHAHITFHVDDTTRVEPNPCLGHVVDEVLAEISQARAEGRPVLVHCRHGASRTGLILRALLVEEHRLDPESALTEAQCLWPHTSTWNSAWAVEVARRY